MWVGEKDELSWTFGVAPGSRVYIPENYAFFCPLQDGAIPCKSVRRSYSQMRRLLSCHPFGCFLANAGNAPVCVPISGRSAGMIGWFPTSCVPFHQCNFLTLDENIGRQFDRIWLGRRQEISQRRRSGKFHYIVTNASADTRKTLLTSHENSNLNLKAPFSHKSGIVDKTTKPTSGLPADVSRFCRYCMASTPKLLMLQYCWPPIRITYHRHLLHVLSTETLCFMYCNLTLQLVILLTNLDFRDYVSLPRNSIRGDHSVDPQENRQS